MSHLFGAQNSNQLSKLDADQVGHLLVHQVHLQLDTDTVQNVVVVVAAAVDNILVIAEWVGKNDLILEKKAVQHWSLLFEQVVEETFDAELAELE